MINRERCAGMEKKVFYLFRFCHVFLQECKSSLQDFILPVESEVMQDIYAVGTQENNVIK